MAHTPSNPVAWHRPSVLRWIRSAAFAVSRGENLDVLTLPRCQDPVNGRATVLNVPLQVIEPRKHHATRSVSVQPATGGQRVGNALEKELAVKVPSWSCRFHPVAFFGLLFLSSDVQSRRSGRGPKSEPV